MYMAGMDNVCGCNEGKLGGLGAGWTSAAGAALTAFGGGGGGGGGGGNSNANENTVTTSTSVQVSPQISPNFIQQQQPQNSAVNASAVSTPSGPMMPVDVAPTIPMPGYMPTTGLMPGIDTGYNVPPSTYAPSSANGINMQTIAFGAVAIGAAMFLAKRKKQRK